MLTPEEMSIVTAYRDLFDRRKVWRTATWRGHCAAKIPNDFWLYQEVIFDLRPALIVEFGTNHGGSALFFADMMDLAGIYGSRVLSIDIRTTADLPHHDRLDYFVGHSRHDPAIARVKEAVAQAGPYGPVMFIEDSEHSPEHVAGELEIYAPMVTPGSYFVIEDAGWPDQTRVILDEIDAFLARNPDFEVDETKWKYLMTLAPGGWLRRRGHR